MWPMETAVATRTMARSAKVVTVVRTHERTRDVYMQQTRDGVAKNLVEGRLSTQRVYRVDEVMRAGASGGRRGCLPTSWTPFEPPSGSANADAGI